MGFGADGGPEDGGPSGKLDGSPCDAGPECAGNFCSAYTCSGNNCAAPDGGVVPGICLTGTTCVVHHDDPGCDFFGHCGPGGWAGLCRVPCGSCRPHTSCTGSDDGYCIEDLEWDQLSIFIDPTGGARHDYPVSLRGDTQHVPDGVTIASWSWDFGDGTQGSGQSVQHAWAVTATYQVSLTATGSNGQTAQATTAVTLSCTADGGFCGSDSECCEGNVCFQDSCTPSALACVGDGGFCTTSGQCCGGLGCTFDSCAP